MIEKKKRVTMMPNYWILSIKKNTRVQWIKFIVLVEKLILTRASKLIPKIHYTKEFAQIRREKKKYVALGEIPYSQDSLKFIRFH